jgi:hypothetical protein
MKKPIIEVDIVPHSTQRYDTPGDWQFIGAGQDWRLRVSVSNLSETKPYVGHPWYEVALALHEVIEALLCRAQGVTEEAVDLWDKQSVWKTHGFSEPGEDPECPYYKQHMFAEAFERLFISQLGLSWREYSERLTQLVYTTTPSKSCICRCGQVELSHVASYVRMLNGDSHSVEVCRLRTASVRSD